MLFNIVIMHLYFTLMSKVLNGTGVFLLIITALWISDLVKARHLDYLAKHLHHTYSGSEPFVRHFIEMALKAYQPYYFSYTANEDYKIRIQSLT
ncbi:putative DNA-binding protein [Pseudochrobactrum saccharolyticum]|uniref:Putative DNA-binding protein n=1 Tax=Pseudochrobactrum saccharolyticum TaxID=354352 RepID=A0A7W8EQZ9_9HYPH|nr:putative DNA-binding protein [Pseudochrobactrum saccharolyticum]